MARILVVDDEPLVVRTLTALLAGNGFEAVSAGSGEEALELLARTSVDLVFLDVLLPGLSGLETCARIRERHGPSLPVVMISARPDREAVRAGYEAGADDYMAKPVDTLALILKVRVLLRLKALHDELLSSREELKRGVADLAQLHEIGRDWSLIAEPREFYSMVTQRLATLIGAQVCLIAHHDPTSHTLRAALPVHGIPDERARSLRYTVTPEYRALWNFRSGRPYLSNRARSDPRLVQEMVQAVGAESVVIVPMIAEGRVLGLLCAVNKPGGFSDADAQLLSIFAGPAATFLRSREIFEQERQHSTRLEQLSGLARDMAAATGRAPLLSLTVSRLQADFGCEWVAFYAVSDGEPELEAESGERGGRSLSQLELLRWSIRTARPLTAAATEPAADLAVPVRAGEELLGVLGLQRGREQPFGEDEQNLLSALAGQLAVTLQNLHGLAATERLARQMATLYDVGLETSALRDLRQLFAKGAEEAGRLIKADHTSVFRYEEPSQALHLFAAWARQPSREFFSEPVFKLGEGIAGRVAIDRLPVMINEAGATPQFVTKGAPVSRLLCVPLTYYDQERETVALFGVLNATRRPGGARFTNHDIEYLTRFAGQLSIAVANSMLFQAERERSEQLALVNTLIREIAGKLSRERILETAARRIHEAFEYPLVKIGVPDRISGELKVAVAASREPRPEGWVGQPLGSIAEQAFREGRTVLVSDDEAEPGAPRPHASGSQLAMPIRAGEDVLAVLKIESDAQHAFGRSRMVTLETLAEGIGIILRNAELYQALEQTNSKLVELDRTKSELVNIVAHDFRAPLAGVLGYAELLEWKPEAPREERVEHSRAIIQSATHMATMVDKTLKTTRLETGHFPFEFKVLDVGAVVREVLARFPHSAAHPLEVKLPEDPLPAWADRERVAEVLDNLLTNAVKYSPAGGPLRLVAESVGETITLRVTDQGIGIAAADMDRLFRPFSRVRNRQTADIEGTGLGLYICERIVRAHGGRLWAESEPGRGSTFALSLPLYGVTAQTRAPLLLVAASDEATRRELRRIASELSYGVAEVQDGVEAIEASQRLLPAAVIVDRVLPKLGAVELAQRLRDTPQTSGVPVFVLASERDLGENASLFRACVEKPLDRPRLMLALESVGAAPSRRA
jgi:signal transduction histidine kinase/DNA-binding response OmpR family regulator